MNEATKENKLVVNVLFGDSINLVDAENMLI